MPEATLNPVLRDFWLASHNEKGERVRNRVLYGGRSSSKSWDAAGFAIFLASNYKLRFLCLRQFQNKLSESVYTLLVHQVNRFGLKDDFEIGASSIVHKVTGSEFLFYGLWRSIDEIKSMEGIDIAWVEEAHALTEEQYKILWPTVRKDWSQFWVIFNPKYATDFTYKRFIVNPPKGTLSRLINYTDNSFLSQTMIDEIEGAKEEDYEAYEHVYLGIPYDNDDASIIKRKWIMASVDGHKRLQMEVTGSRVTGFDVADSGEDSCAYVDTHGVLAYHCDLWKAGEDELKKSATRVYSRAREIGSEVVYDAIGVGAHVGSDINDLNSQNGTSIKHSKFFAGSGVYKPDSYYGETKIANKDFFSNVKAQAWWMIADRFRNTYNAVTNGAKFEQEDLIFIDSAMPNLEKLIDELTTPRRDFDASGKVKVESKKDLAKPNREGGPQPSPNLADAFVMANVAPYVRSRSWFG